MEREHNNRENRDVFRREQLAKRLRDLPGIRQEVVARIRMRIARGKYLTPGKLETAVCRLIQDVRALESLGF